MPKPLVSIVIPVYNQRLDFFQEAVESALKQTYPHLEIIVSDNHSTNELPAYLASIKDSRLRVVKPEKFLPMAVNFQFGGDQATGDYIFFLCSDDWIYPAAVETLTDQMIANPQTSVAYSATEHANFKEFDKVRLYSNHKRSGLRSAAESLDELLHTRPFYGCIPGALIRQSAYRQVRQLLNGDITFAFDVALLFKLHELGDVIYLGEPLAKLRIWKAQDGKLGGARLLENIADFGRCCEIIEESPQLVGYLPNGLDDVKEWRAYLGKRRILSLLSGIVTGTIDSETCRKGIATIRKHIYPNPTGALALSALIAKPQVFLFKPALSFLYKFYLSFLYRTKREA